MKNIKLAILFIAILLCSNAFAQSASNTKATTKLKSDENFLENLLLIFKDAKNNFEKYRGEVKLGDIYKVFGAEQVEYKLSIGGGSETFFRTNAKYKFIFNAKFYWGEEQEKKADAIKAVLESLKPELVNKNNYTVTQKGDVLTLVNTNGLPVFDYTLTNNRLTELNIYGAGDELNIFGDVTDIGKIPLREIEQKAELENPVAAEKKEENTTDIEQNLLAIIKDSKDDFKKYIGESLGPQLYSAQTFEYGLTLGVTEKMYKYFDINGELSQLGFNAKFNTEEEIVKAVTIKTLLEGLTEKMIVDYNYRKKQVKNIIAVFDADNLYVYDYKVVNNLLTELNFYSSGAEQLARSKKGKSGK